MSYLLDALQTRVGEFISLRRDLHRHPELAFEEHRTAALVADKLATWGYEVHTGLGGTGVVGVLRRGGGSRCLGLRADMDALPVHEESGVAWASQRPGLMHACGHDGHTAMLLSAARHLAEHGGFDGTLVLIFQPAEEGGGGALRMMADGLFERFPCDAVFAMHNMPGVPQGRLVLREGAAMASSDYATITLTGVGGHGGMPQHSADPVVAAASLVMALQTVVSRNIDPTQTAVVTIGTLKAGIAANVIPESASMSLSVRSFSAAVREQLRQRITDLVTLHVQGYGGSVEIEYQQGYPVVVNSEAETAFALQVAQQLVGAERTISPFGPVTGSEDFAYFLQHRPGCFLRLGNGEGGAMLHNAKYDFNDGNLTVGAAYWTRLVETYLAADTVS